VAFQAARSAGILPVVAAGNDWEDGVVAWPACAPEAVSVGATFDRVNSDWTWWCGRTAADQVACFSNNANHLTLLAPGCTIKAGVDTNGRALLMCGTSQAAPHVAGAIAVLKAAVPHATPDQIVQALQQSGKPVADPRDAKLVRPRLSLKAAVDKLLVLAGPGGGGGGSGGGSAPPSTGDVKPPKVASLAINAGEAFASSLAVELAITGSDNIGVATMCVTNQDPSTVCARAADFRPFAARTPWLLADGADGARRVSVVVRDASGNAGAAAATIIKLDTTPPSMDRVKFVTPSRTKTSVTLKWRGAARDTGSGVAAYRVTCCSLAEDPPEFCEGNEAAGVRSLTVSARSRAAARSATFELPAPAGRDEGNGTASVFRYRVCAVDKANQVSAGVAGRVTLN
jgi:hypothetical protein